MQKSIFYYRCLSQQRIHLMSVLGTLTFVQDRVLKLKGKP